MDFHGFLIRFGDFVVINGHHAVVFRRDRRVYPVVVDVGGVEDRDSRVVRIAFRGIMVRYASFQFLQDKGAQRYNQYYQDNVDFFHFLVFRLLTARREARGVDKRRAIVRWGNLDRILGETNGILRRVGIRDAEGPYTHVFKVFGGDQYVYVSRYGVRLCLFFNG